MAGDWLRCRKGRLCPICEHSDWCSVTPDGALVHCMRAQSDWPVAKGGWIHRLTDRPENLPTPRRVVPAQASDARVDFERMLTTYREKTDLEAVARHAEHLGVQRGSLYTLGIVWAAPHQAWAFPMRDIKGVVVGLRLRNERGEKWAVQGSKEGLFTPMDIAPAVDEPVFVCEGPTDTAAMLSLGLYSLGRPSCTACLDLLTKMLRRRPVVIVGDRDEPKIRPDGTTWLPGQEGAERLADALALSGAASVKLIYPLKGKDARAWLAAGATADIVKTRVRNASLWKPKTRSSS